MGKKKNLFYNDGPKFCNLKPKIKRLMKNFLRIENYTNNQQKKILIMLQTDR